MLIVTQKVFLQELPPSKSDLKKLNLLPAFDSHLGKTISPSTTTEIDSMLKIPYREAVGSFFVNQVSRFYLNPCLMHWKSFTMLTGL